MERWRTAGAPILLEIDASIALYLFLFCYPLRAPNMLCLIGRIPKVALIGI
jgi:hypothetical protein